MKNQTSKEVAAATWAKAISVIEAMASIEGLTARNLEGEQDAGAIAAKNLAKSYHHILSKAVEHLRSTAKADLSSQ